VYHPIRAGVPQGSVLGPLLYMLYTADVPTTPDTLMATFADDTSILSSDPDPVRATEKLQHHLTLLHWLEQWRIKVNPTKSAHVTFTTRRDTCPLSESPQYSHTCQKRSKIPRTSPRRKTNMKDAHKSQTMPTGT